MFCICTSSADKAIPLDVGFQLVAGSKNSRIVFFASLLPLALSRKISISALRSTWRSCTVGYQDHSVSLLSHCHPFRPRENLNQHQNGTLQHGQSTLDTKLDGLQKHCPLLFQAASLGPAEIERKLFRVPQVCFIFLPAAKDCPFRPLLAKLNLASPA